MEEAEIHREKRPHPQRPDELGFEFLFWQPGWNPNGPWVFAGGPLHRVGEAKMKIRDC